MYSITEKTIGKAWLKAVSLLLADYEKASDDKGMILEILSLIIHITDPIVNDNILEHYANAEILAFMEKNFRDLNAISDWKYSYAQRLYDYNGANQIKDIIKALQSNHLAKSATISLLDINADTNHKPCLVALDFKIRNDKLLVTGFFRSQDLGKKMYADALELVHIGNIVGEALAISKVEIILFVSSAHIYQEDQPGILRILREQGID